MCEEELKDLFNEYLDNDRRLRCLRREKEVLSEHGRNTYQSLKNRNNKIKTVLASNGVNVPY